uniref:DNA/RNA-binding protein Kin17 WH-like domain-containing protein n=1 Tax=Globodera rostochiensis TaxID=31243 RepID=A0A914H1W1_GLORO
MPKHEKGTPKEIANRSKAKGLQKLKWFCQMCQKQCRDQNGFKCHMTSESHQRQLLLFAENQNSYLRQFSREFEGNFMHILRHTFGAKRVRANDVYQEYIKDKGHVHMNSTSWHTLTGFVLYLGKSGKCKIDENEKGWHIQYIDQEEELRRQKLQQRVKQEKDDEERMQEQLQRQIERAKEKQGDQSEDGESKEPQELIRNDDTKIAFSLGLKKPLMLADVKPTTAAAAELFKIGAGSKNVFSRPNPLREAQRPGTSRQDTPANAGQKRKSALEEIMAEEEEALKNKRDLKKYWMHR